MTSVASPVPSRDVAPVLHGLTELSRAPGDAEPWLASAHSEEPHRSPWGHDDSASPADEPDRPRWKYP